MNIVLGSSNPHKVKEINEIASYPYILNACTEENSGKNIKVNFILPPKDFNPDETGTTFEENSLIKAKEAWTLAHTWSLADDSGLCIDALDGNPGIYSARYAETPQKRIERVLKELEGVKNRTAHFTCHMTLLAPNGSTALSCEGICKGSIAYEPKGVNGFGYDPIFIPDRYNKTIAELEEEEKNRISHRSNALIQIIKYLYSL